MQDAANNIGQIATGTINVESGPAGGQVHLFTASYRLATLDWTIGGREYKPLLEIPLTLGIVDENERSPFLNLDVSLQIRWRDFPWNHLVRTTAATGIGLSYAENVWLMDIQRHPNDSRSRLKFNWPLQLTFAHPAHPDHQLTLFIAHQSGGYIFDRGGVNSLGIGYRVEF